MNEYSSLESNLDSCVITSRKASDYETSRRIIYPVEGMDYHDTCAPVAKLVIVRVLLTLVMARGWVIDQLDVHNVFLNDDLIEEVYMQPPPGYRRKGEIFVCKLWKSVHGLKQASRSWFSKLSVALIRIGFSSSKPDPSLFILQQGTDVFYLLIYVNDILIRGSNKESLQHIKGQICATFHTKDLGPLKFLLGIEVARSRSNLYVSQHKYILDILLDSGLTGVEPIEFPMEWNLHLSTTTGSPLPDSSYRRLIG
ncbi:Retrovirus-related Pol polyprotein from transposon RE2-like protein [Drosera capensis]